MLKAAVCHFLSPSVASEANYNNNATNLQPHAYLFFFKVERLVLQLREGPEKQALVVMYTIHKEQNTSVHTVIRK